MLKYVLLVVLAAVGGGLGIAYFVDTKAGGDVTYAATRDGQAGSDPAGSGHVDAAAESAMRVGFEPAPAGRFRAGIDLEMRFMHRTSVTNLSLFGSMRGERDDDATDLFITLDRVEAMSRTGRIIQQTDDAAHCRYDGEGRLSEWSVIGSVMMPDDLPMAPPPLTMEMPTQALAIGDLRIGDSFPIGIPCPLRQPYFGGQTFAMTATVLGATDYGGRPAVELSLTGTLESHLISGMFSGWAILDQASGVLLESDISASFNIPVSRDSALATVDVRFAVDLESAVDGVAAAPAFEFESTPDRVY